MIWPRAMRRRSFASTLRMTRVLGRRNHLVVRGLLLRLRQLAAAASDRLDGPRLCRIRRAGIDDRHVARLVAGKAVQNGSVLTDKLHGRLLGSEAQVGEAVR